MNSRRETVIVSRLLLNSYFLYAAATSSTRSLSVSNFGSLRNTSYLLSTSITSSSTSNESSISSLGVLSGRISSSGTPTSSCTVLRRKSNISILPPNAIYNRRIRQTTINRPFGGKRRFNSIQLQHPQGFIGLIGVCLISNKNMRHLKKQCRR